MRVRADSKLVIEQVKGTWKVKQPHLRPLLDAGARSCSPATRVVDLRHVPARENTDADALVNAALDAPATGRRDPLMVLWFVFGAIFGVWNVFQSPGLDFRLIAAGALLPELIDLPFGAQAYAHTLLAAIVVLIGDDARAPPVAAAGCAAGARSAWRSAGSPALVLSAAWSAQGGVLVARVRRVPAGRARCSPAWPVVVVEELLGARGRVVDVDALRSPRRVRVAASCCATGRLTIVGGGRVIAFVRHGQTELNRGGRLQGRLDAPLSDLGGEQAAALGTRIRVAAGDAAC